MYEENVKDPLGWLRKRGTDPNAINKVFVNGQEVNAKDFFKNSKMIRFQKEDNPIEISRIKSGNKFT